MYDDAHYGKHSPWNLGPHGYLVRVSPGGRHRRPGTVNQWKTGLVVYLTRQRVFQRVRVDTAHPRDPIHRRVYSVPL